MPHRALHASQLVQPLVAANQQHARKPDRVLLRSLRQERLREPNRVPGEVGSQQSHTLARASATRVFTAMASL
jgi:hypothetical protein